MARPKKDNADYFSHDAGMRNHRKIKALRSKFGHEGFSIWNMLLEHLCSCDHFSAKYDEIEKEILAGDFSTDCSRLDEVVVFLLQIGLLQKEGEFLQSQSLLDRMMPMIEKRERERSKSRGVSAAETTQSKVKEIKGNKSKENNPEIQSPDDAQQKIIDAQKRNAVNTRGQSWKNLRNEITGKNDLMDETTFRGLQNMIGDMSNPDFEKRVYIFKDCIDLIKKHSLSKYFDAFGTNNITTYSFTDFIKKINLFGDDIDFVFKKIISKDYVNKVLKLIHPPLPNLPEKADSSGKVEPTEEEKASHKAKLEDLKKKMNKI